MNRERYELSAGVRKLSGPDEHLWVLEIEGEINGHKIRTSHIESSDTPAHQVPQLPLLHSQATLIETAMCLWEAGLELLENNDAVGSRFNAEREEHGTAHLRMMLSSWTPQCEASWEKVAEDFEGSFDWDFVPKWLRERLKGRYGL